MQFQGGGGNDTFKSGPGSEVFDGGSGQDKGVLAGNADGYTIAWDGTTAVVTVTGLDPPDATNASEAGDNE